MKATVRKPLLVVLAIVAASGSIASFTGSAIATHAPANKVSVAASTMERMQTQLVEGASSSSVELLRGKMKTSAPTDLVLQVAAECALVTNTVNVGDSDSEAVATVRVWVEIDGKPVSVSQNAGDNGQVVFCNRAFRSSIANFADQDDIEEEDDGVKEEEELRLYERTRSAHAFNWIKLNVGKGTHSIVVRSILEAEVTGAGTATAIVGSRTMVVEPTKLANDASF